MSFDVSPENGGVGLVGGAGEYFLYMQICIWMCVPNGHLFSAAKYIMGPFFFSKKYMNGPVFLD